MTKTPILIYYLGIIFCFGYICYHSGFKSGMNVEEKFYIQYMKDWCK